MIKRSIDLNKYLEKNKVLIIYGARQVGKTTLVKNFLSNTNLKYSFYTGDDIQFAKDLSKCDLYTIKKLVGDIELLVIDEAQKIDNIGRALKLIVDNIDNIYVLVTGSSSFDLANSTSEPLTGRKNLITLYPISLQELLYDTTQYNLSRRLGEFLVYGMYPNVVSLDSFKDKENRINEIRDSYLIKDILEFNKVKRSQLVVDLLRHLAFQVGSEVSTVELGRNLGIDNKTVKRYLDLLEKSFVIFSLSGFSRNLRKEISKMEKYYFYDNGIRNSLIKNFNDLDTRNDVGQLWENFLMVERMKKNSYNKLSVNYYFWRTYDQKEIDLIEERGGKLYGYEFKWNHKDVKEPKEWIEEYDSSEFKVIDRENFLDFVISQ
ncbi:MAG: Putative ATPase (AAA+ superfamily), partial [candidate division WS6 bacterium 34_10]